MKTKKTYSYKGDEVYLTLERYQEGNRIAMCMFTTEHEPYAICSLNPSEGTVLKEGEMVVKNYSENEMMYLWLLGNDLANPTLKEYHTGWISCPIVTINFDRFEEEEL